MEKRKLSDDEVIVLDFIALAKKAHDGQKRRNGEPYFNHPMRVSERVDTENRRMVAIGHDLFEDTKVTPEDLLREGVPECVVRSIQVLTRQHGENYFDYVNRVIASKDYDAMAVKLADLEDNMSDLDEGSMKDKYRFTKDKIEKACFQIGGTVLPVPDVADRWVSPKPVFIITRRGTWWPLDAVVRIFPFCHKDCPWKSIANWCYLFNRSTFNCADHKDYVHRCWECVSDKMTKEYKGKAGDV